MMQKNVKLYYGLSFLAGALLDFLNVLFLSIVNMNVAGNLLTGVGVATMLGVVVVLFVISMYLMFKPIVYLARKRKV